MFDCLKRADGPAELLAAGGVSRRHLGAGAQPANRFGRGQQPKNARRYTDGVREYLGNPRGGQTDHDHRCKQLVHRVDGSGTDAVTGLHQDKVVAGRKQEQVGTGLGQYRHRSGRDCRITNGSIAVGADARDHVTGHQPRQPPLALSVGPGFGDHRRHRDRGQKGPAHRGAT